MNKRIAAAAAAIVCCLSLSACGHAAQTYTEYVTAVMDCTYQGNTDAYRKLTKVSESDAASIHQDEVTYLSEQLCYQASVDRSSLDAETVSAYDAMAETLLGKVKYSASNAVKSGDYYQVTVTAEPLDLWDNVQKELEDAYKNGFSKAFYNETPGTDSYAALESAWGKRALEIYQAHLDQTGNGEAKTLTTVLYPDSAGHYTVSSSSWRQIDQLVFGLEG